MKRGAKLKMRLDDKTRARLRTRAGVLKAMAHETRLFILSVLAGGERCVRDLTQMIGSDISTVSRHLSILRSAGLLSSEKRANQVFYRLDCMCLDSFFDCIEKVVTRKRLRDA